MWIDRSVLMWYYRACIQLKWVNICDTSVSIVQGSQLIFARLSTAGAALVAMISSMNQSWYSYSCLTPTRAFQSWIKGCAFISCPALRLPPGNARPY